MGKRISKSSQIFDELKQRLSQMQKGEKFSTEYSLCEEFGVSRMTINKIIKSLEEKNYLKRVQGSGTYVDKPVGDKSIKFLLPCPEYMVYDCTYPLRLTLYGAERQAAEMGRNIEGIWVSATNSPNDIDLSRLDSLEEGTDVIVYSSWFRNTFDLIKERKCNTVFISPQESRIQADLPDTWLTLSADPENGIKKAVNYLATVSQKNIAFVHSYKENNHYMKLAFEEALKANGKKVDPALFCQFESSDSLERGILRLINQLKDKFDAILMSDSNNTSTVLRLMTSNGLSVPDDIALMTFGDSQWLLQQHPPISAVGTPYVKFGKEAVKNLASGSMNSGNMIFNMDLTIRESTQKGTGAPVSLNCFPASSGLEGFNT